VRRNVTMLKRRLCALGVPVTFERVWPDGVGDGRSGYADRCGRISPASPDVILPMVYPEPLLPGAYGYSWPNGQPYEIVRHALREALERTRGCGAADPAVPPSLHTGGRKPRYTPFEIREEIRAARSWASIRGCCESRSVYQRDCLRPYRAGVHFAQRGPTEGSK